VTCGTCGADNRPEARFCSTCGAGLTRVCPNGHPVPAEARFCDECGAPLGLHPPVEPAAESGPQAERRLVSVLFADLVGFTAASEGRDAEDTRELLTRYFDLARTTIERYGGTVEKFIGDAVMAVWGAPVANEDDAERAVRAALELVAAIPPLDPALEARAGVLTGEAAVTVGAEGQGMVAGDLVNTASRIQSAAEPGSVLVGDSTRRASDAAIAYESAGDHELKGKTQLVTLWRALRVAAQRRGEGRATGLEPPFVGRDRELRMVKDLFHASADEKRARLVSVVGIAGIGKSRLSWEFEKYVDGLAADVWWHRGRCLSYGDGVAYWALAEMIRGRAKIAENEDASSAASKLRATLEVHLADPKERAWIEPRLLQLLGLAERSAPDREDLFAAWRRFFERLAEQGPLVLVFEDIHWADEGLVAFVEYLLDWGRHHPIFVLTLSRPEIADRHPAFPGTTRSATTLPLEPLAGEAMDELLLGLVPALPDELRDRLRDAAEGIPLYAVETVRMLRDRGLLTEAAGSAIVAGDLSSFEVPETLHALIASRLDAVSDDERSLLQDASVLGKTFTRSGLVSLSGRSAEQIEQLVSSLIRKELLAVETDPFSPERGQLGFLQALVQRVTYETIARRDRRRRHLAAARFLATDAGIDPDEIAEVIASHYLDAHAADSTAVDGDDVRAEARRWFTRAAERAASLAASLEAQRSFERAADLAGDPVERGQSLARAGELALAGGRLDEASSLLEEAIAILGGDSPTDAAVAQVRLGELLFMSNRIEEGVALLETALGAHEHEGDEPAIAAVSAELGRLLFFEARGAEAMPHVERALDLAEHLRLSSVVVQGLINKGLLLHHRPNESVALVRQALVLAEESGDERGALRACMNLSYLLSLAGRTQEAEEVVEHGIGVARRRGDRTWERSLTTNLVSLYLTSGRWDDAERVIGELPEEGLIASDPVQASKMLDLAQIALYRGEMSRVRELASEYAAWEETAYVQAAGTAIWARLLLAQSELRHEDALRESRDTLRDPAHTSDPVAVEVLLQVASESAHALGSSEALADVLALAEAAPIDRSASLLAHLELQRARLAASSDDEEAPFEAAVGALRAIGDPYWVAVALLEQAEWLATKERFGEAAPLAREAQDVFVRLRALPKLERLERLDAALGPRAAEAPASA